MIGCTVQQLCNAVGGTLLQESGAVVTEVSTDSRSIPAGALFVPLVGERFDGHDYLETALSAGAAGCNRVFSAFCSRMRSHRHSVQ